VIAGKSVVAFRREDEEEVPSAKCFGYVQSYDEKPRQRLWELMKSQGMQENQQVVFMTDGGENVRRVQEYLHPFSEHLIDWFHIAMRLTVLQQQTKALLEERPKTGADVSKQLESVKHLLWHGNTEEALERLSDLLMGCAHETDRSVTLIASSGYSDAPVMSEFRRYGFDDVIPKPWTPNQLSEVLQRCQRRQENRGKPVNSPQGMNPSILPGCQPCR
jgi:CheY-like chemotaxis protein